MAFKLSIVDENGKPVKTTKLEGERKLEIVGILPANIKESIIKEGKKQKRSFGLENYDQIFLVKIDGLDDNDDYFKYRTYGLNGSTMELERLKLRIGKFYEGYAIIDLPFLGHVYISQKGEFLDLPDLDFSLSRLDDEERDKTATHYDVYSWGPFKNGVAEIEVFNNKSPVRTFEMNKNGLILDELTDGKTV